MNDTPARRSFQHQTETYEVRLRGHLDLGWANRLDVPSLTHEDDGTTTLRGIAADQATLHGLLQRIRDLGPTLVSVIHIGPPPTSQTKDAKMRITASSLLRWSGLAAMVAGTSYALVGVFHPPNEVSAVTSTAWIASHILAMAMSVFGLPGLAGLYVRQAEKPGWLGLAGYLLLSLWMALILGFTFVEVFVLPALATAAPTFVAGWLGLFNGTASDLDLGALPIVWLLAGPLYILDGLLFGIATFRARILPRWAGVLLAVGTAIGPLAALVPHDWQPKAAIPVGLALLWLGYSLWSNRLEKSALT